MSGILPKMIRRTSLVSRAQRLATIAAAPRVKPEGDISSVFVSLSGIEAAPLPDRFARQKQKLILGHEDQLKTSWDELLSQLRKEVKYLKENGSAVIPQIEFKDIDVSPESFLKELKKRGAGIIRNVVDEDQALQYKSDVQDYIRANPSTRAFPPHDPQVYELYWSPSQVRARAHPNMIVAQKFLMGSWHSKDPNALISTSHPLSYADRLRIRQPGDSSFALGAHVDGGSVERWEAAGYGRGKVYDKIFAGRWQEYDPWESSCRLPVESDLYGGAGNSSMFRMFQGWVGLSNTGPREGTLLVNPMLQLTTAYYLLRPFFAPRTERASFKETAQFLHASNWQLENPLSSKLQGANPGNGQELNNELHPHLELADSMVHIPKINPGDFVVWHCDTIHAVDKIHKGKTDSSVMYIPVCPLTEANARYVSRQRDAFLQGTPGPDFPGGKGESEHSGRPTEEFMRQNSDVDGLRAFGLDPWSESESGLTSGQLEVVRTSNEILGFNK